MEGMEKEQFMRKYEDTHKGLSVSEKLSKARKTSTKFPSDLNAKNVTRAKRGMERQAIEKRKDDYQHYILDAVAVRAKEILNKKDMPMKDLLKTATSVLPKEVKVESNVTHSFVDLWDTVDITDEE